jgi:hypothetical protein
MCAVHLLSSKAKQPNLKLKTQPKQLLGSLLLDIALPAGVILFLSVIFTNLEQSQILLNKISHRFLVQLFSGRKSLIGIAFPGVILFLVCA